MKQIIEKINKNALLAGVFSTILFIYFLEPILGFLGRTLILFFRSISQTLYDRLFQEIALGKPEYGYILVQIINIIFFNILLLIVIRPINRKKREVASSGETKEENKEIVVIDEATKIKRRINFLYTVKFISIITIIIFGITWVMSDIKLKTIQSFEQQIKIITPYIDQHTKELLISDFSRMKNSSDFDRIKNTIISIAEKNSITLPKTRNHLF